MLCDQRRPVHLRQHLRHRERLAGTGHAEQDLMGIAAIQTLDELRHGAHLIAAQVEVADKGEPVVNGRH